MLVPPDIKTDDSRAFRQGWQTIFGLPEGLRIPFAFPDMINYKKLIGKENSTGNSNADTPKHIDNQRSLI